MPNVVGPLLSFGAKGTIKKIFSFQDKKSGAVVQKYAYPGSVKPFTPSASQNTQREKIKDLVAQWQALGSVAKAAWNDAAVAVNYVGTGYHYFIHKQGALATIYEWSDPTAAWSDGFASWA